MIIAVDFDGTIVEHRYPEIGREIPFAVETLKSSSKTATNSSYGAYGKGACWMRPWNGAAREE